MNVVQQSRPSAKRMTINDVMTEDNPHVYVLNHAARQHGVIAHILLPFTSSQTGDKRSIEIPMTAIPIDLADFAPKEELMRNPELRDLWNSGTIEFVSADVAQEKLDTDDARNEQDRLQALRQSRRRAGPDNQMRDALSPEQVAADARQNSPGLAQEAAGEYDKASVGVQSSVVSALNDKDMTDSHRQSLIRNLNDSGLLTEADKKYIRGNTEDQVIRKLVA